MHLVKVLSKRDRIDAAGGTVVAAVCDEPARVRAGLLREIESPYPVIVDIERLAYRTWGLARAPLTRLVTHPGWVADYARALIRPTDRPARPGRDILQLGGDFVIAPGGLIALSRPQEGFDDRPPAGDLIEALESAAQGGSVL